MGDYKEVTSSLEGRLFLLPGKPRRPSTNIEDYYQPRPDTQAIVNSWLSLKASNITAASNANGSNAKEQTGFVQDQASSRPAQRRSDRSLIQAPSFDEKPTSSASQQAFQLTIELAEPILHLEGFDASHTRAHRSTVLRGLLKLQVNKSSVLKELSLAFDGVSKSEWPESWRLRKLKKVCEEPILSHSWDFIQDGQPTLRKKSSKSKTFKPGLYAMNFELPLESSLPETINLPLGAVSYALTAKATTDTGSSSAICKRDVTFIRVPCACSLELVEPYGVHGSQHGLRYSFGLFSKSVAIGGRVPLSMRIASIQEVSWERITISMIEDIQYRTRDGLAQREQSRTTAILMDRRAAVVQRPSARRAIRRISTTGERLRHAHAAAADVEKPPRRGSTSSSEPELHLLEKAILDIPTCAVLQADTAYSCIYVRHYLVITILSRIDLDETTHRNFEVQIKMPIQILSCQITKGNTTLPEYTPEPLCDSTLEPAPLCGCQGSSKRIIEMPELEEDDSMLERWTSGSTRSMWRHDLPGYDDHV